jgi:FkbM family methyltransferase
MPRWLLNNPEDEIQRYLSRGEWYEHEELMAIRDRCNPCRTIVDVGANIGNHAVFFDKMCNCEKVIVFEPHRDAFTLLLANLALNYCHKTVVDHLGVALGSSTGLASISHQEANNLGATELQQTTHGHIPVITGDSVLHNELVDVIKIDVEGWEIQVLDGLDQTINRCCPLLLVEANNSNIDSLKQWADAKNYQLVQAWQRYTTSVNFLLEPTQQQM